MQLDLSVVSLIVGALSVVLGLFAIWLSLRFKNEADRVNEKTVDLLVDIRSDAKAISSFAMPELARYGEAARQAMLGRMAAATGTTITTNVSETAETPDADN